MDFYWHASAETAPGRDWAIDRFVTALRPCTSGDGNTSLTQGFVGPTILTSRHSCRGHDGGVILVGHLGCGAIAQEGPSLVFSTGVVPMRKALFVGLCHSHFSYFCPDFERWCWGGRSCTS
jgi:hypothetical protein